MQENESKVIKDQIFLDKDISKYTFPAGHKSENCSITCDDSQEKEPSMIESGISKFSGSATLSWDKYVRK